MKKITRILFAAALLLLAAAPCVYAEEAITNYHQDIVISRDSTIIVTEEITADVEHININRGIIRKFPLTRKDKNGNEVSVGFKLLKVMLDGMDAKYQADENGGYNVIKIGDKDTILPRGSHTFTIVFAVTGEVGFFDDHDELYWNVTGNEWDFPIQKASCSVSLPGKGSGEGFTDVTWFTGAYGERGSKKGAKLTERKDVITTATLPANSGLTVVYAWPKGLVTPPPLPKRDNDKVHTIIGAIVFLLTGGWFAFAWEKWGKDPVVTVIPVFGPPDNISPAAMQYLREDDTDSKALSADIIDLAVKGAITIEETQGAKVLFFKGAKKYILHKKNNAPASLTKDELSVFDALFADSVDTVELSKDNSSSFITASDRMDAKCRSIIGTIFSRNTDKCLVGALLYAAGTAALYPWSGELPVNMFAAAILGVLLILIAMRRRKEPRKIVTATLMSILCLVIPVILIAVFAAVVFEEGNSPLPVIFFGASTLIINIMRPLMIARSDKSAELLAQTDGLKMYMETAEKDRLEMLDAPDETPQLFERLLPYALVLGVAKTWADRFSSVLDVEKYQPDWYSGSAGDMLWNAYWFNAFTSDFGSQIATSSVIQSVGDGFGGGDWSSGFGGGGFSGGGGGGGGGSGW